MKKDQHKPVSTLKFNLKANKEKIKEGLNYDQNSLPKYYKQTEQKEFQQLHREYLTEKLSRKKELQFRKRQQFGSTSSEQDDVGASESASDSEKRHSTFEQEKRFQESQKMKEQRKPTEKELKCNIYFCMKKGKQVWSQQSLYLQEQDLIISQRSYPLMQFHKIKLIQGPVVADCSRIKLSCIDQSQIFIAANNKPYNKELPLNYHIFAFVIQQKLINMGQKLYKCQGPNIPGIPQALAKNSYNYGNLYKKSQIFGRWEERLIVINKEGIYSYKKFNEKHSMFISGSSLKEIWTRFEIEQGLLVIKILHSSSTKTEFGIPLTEVLDKRSWLYSFYLLAFPQ